MLYSKIEGSGRPFFILHGYLGMSDNWKTLAQRFAQQGYQVHALDLRNHGRSFHSDEFTYEAMAQDLIEYADAHNLPAFDLLGHSMGGKLAMFVATENPDRIQKLIIADMAPRYYRPHHQDIMAGLNAVDFTKKPDRVQVEHVLSAYVSDKGTRQFLMKSLYWVEPGQLGWRFNLPVFNEKIDNIGQALPEGAVFKKPTLFLKGANSNYISERDFADIDTHFPDSEIVTIANAGHWLHAEHPEDFYEAVIAFLKK